MSPEVPKKRPFKLKKFALYTEEKNENINNKSKFFLLSSFGDGKRPFWNQCT